MIARKSNMTEIYITTILATTLANERKADNLDYNFLEIINTHAGTITPFPT